MHVRTFAFQPERRAVLNFFDQIRGAARSRKRAQYMHMVFYTTNNERLAVVLVQYTA